MSRILPRVGASTGAVYFVVLFALGGADKDSQVVVALELFALMFFVPFLGFLYAVLRDAEGPLGWLAPTVLGAGILSITIKIASAAPILASRTLSEGTPLHDSLVKMNDASFIVSMIPLGIMMAAIAVVILKTRVLPAWLGWFAAIAAPALLVNGTLFEAGEGPAFLFYLLWILLTSATLVRGSGARREPEVFAQPAQVLDN